jgi:glycine hydroxymethyltransferase
LGTAAITTRGLKEDDMKNIVNLIDRVLSNLGNTDVLDTVANEVHVLMEGRELFNP